MTVLAAEDNVPNQMVLGAFLGRLGCHAQFANDGAEAIAKWRADSYDLILMDCQMPHVDGFMATREIRSLERASSRSRTPIIGLTGNALEQSRSDCLTAGMDDYLRKPYRVRDLSDIMQKHAKLTGRPDPAASSDTTPG